MFHESFHAIYNPVSQIDNDTRTGVRNEFLNSFTKSVSSDDGDMLNRPFTAKEVRTAVFQMGALKSPGPDGIPAIFFQKCWYIVKKDVTKAALSVLNSGLVLTELNRTFITLVPKNDNPEGVGDYRPISLCNFFMRIVSKCIANRLGKVMRYLVGEFQNAFVPGRQISDNILLAHEALHKINTHKKGKYGRFAFKADMSKAYDRVDWDFLQAVLIKVGLPERLVRLIMNCVRTVSYQVLFNGKPLRLFNPTCGLRQGDPLSPYLFVLCMEALSCKLERAMLDGSLKEICLCREESALTHLFFADDAIFFLQDQGDSSTTLRQILEAYCQASGQVMNENKSGILFSPSTTLGSARRSIKNLKIAGNKGLGKYLGLPTEFLGSKRELFKSIIDMVMKRISSWNGIFLSQAGRLTLINFVLSNISNYFLSVFKIPVSVTNKVNSLLSHFWWAGNRLGKPIHWCSNKFLSLPKSEGGLGIRNIECVNMAMLGKLGWRIISDQDTFFIRVFRQKLLGGRFFGGVTALRSGTNLSWGARSVLQGLDFIRKHIGWKPGLDSDLNVWTTCWTNGDCPEPNVRVLDLDHVGLYNLRIKDLRLPANDAAGMSWNEPLIRTLFSEKSANHILAIHICASRVDDKLYWLHTGIGDYSVKSGYGVLFNEFMERRATTKDKTRIDAEIRHFCKKTLWHLPGPQVWKILVWRIITDSLSTGVNFARRNLGSGKGCHLCDFEGLETMEHLFRDCPVSRRLWASSELGIRVENGVHLSIQKWMVQWIYFLGNLDEAKSRIIRFLAMVSCIWSIRNRVLFQGVPFHPLMFFRLWSNVVDTADKALKGRNKEKECMVPGYGNDVSQKDEWLQWSWESKAVCVVGSLMLCDHVRIMVDAGWKDVATGGLGWVGLSSVGEIIFSGRKRVLVESALQAESLGIREVL
ncbi:uncharacterized protein LOC141608369 [Silene latifolia]|uniref:uncharacterized protein LOC141608369 n=1 Tax=Silene latifolia TaxID=37657 RepID=UPI003D776FF1